MHALNKMKLVASQQASRLLIQSVKSNKPTKARGHTIVILAQKPDQNGTSFQLNAGMKTIVDLWMNCEVIKLFKE